MSDCPFCHEPIDPADRYTLRKVTGWERKAIGPNRRGGSDIAFRTQLDEWAHGHCISKARDGLLGQESMFGR